VDDAVEDVAGECGNAGAEGARYIGNPRPIAFGAAFLRPAIAALANIAGVTH
jgi:hypothetical protein